ncbi:MAG: hypothetical protein GOV15_03700, partial [Candidatus Diapherotrites archaeon]|nr:hypothetical protein [Candidatus Diapherotrites archaeon]
RPYDLDSVRDNVVEVYINDLNGGASFDDVDYVDAELNNIDTKEDAERTKLSTIINAELLAADKNALEEVIIEAFNVLPSDLKSSNAIDMGVMPALTNNINALTEPASNWNRESEKWKQKLNEAIDDKRIELRSELDTELADLKVACRDLGVSGKFEKEVRNVKANDSLLFHDDVVEDTKGVVEDLLLSGKKSHLRENFPVVKLKDLPEIPGVDHPRASHIKNYLKTTPWPEVLDRAEVIEQEKDDAKKAAEEQKRIDEETRREEERQRRIEEDAELRRVRREEDLEHQRALREERAEERRQILEEKREERERLRTEEDTRIEAERQRIREEEAREHQETLNRLRDQALHPPEPEGPSEADRKVELITTLQSWTLEEVSDYFDLGDEPAFNFLKSMGEIRRGDINRIDSGEEAFEEFQNAAANFSRVSVDLLSSEDKAEFIKSVTSTGLSDHWLRRFRGET